jgi:prephenate dehydrogenase
MSNVAQKVAILGTGLIGSSLALALKSQKNPPQIGGFDLNSDSRRGAAGLKASSGTKAFDRVSGNLAETVRGADLVVVSAPVRAMELLFRELATVATPGTVITDTGSTKQQVLAWAEALLPESLPFVGGHPMAGKVSAGPWDADETLFQNATYCLCPLPRTERQAVDRVVKLVESLGATPYFVDAHEHDGLVAAISHLPYLVSVGVVNAVAGGRSWREAATLAAGGFATASHLTESDPQMFTDICITNREAILWQLDQLSAELATLRDGIERGDPAIKSRFDLAQQRHREWLSGRAADGGESRPPIDTASLRPQSIFMPGKLGDLLRGRGREKEERR